MTPEAQQAFIDAHREVMLAWLRIVLARALLNDTPLAIRGLAAANMMVANHPTVRLNAWWSLN